MAQLDWPTDSTDAAENHSQLTVLLADDHPLFRRALRLTLESEPGIVVVGEAADGLEAVTMAKELRPRVALIDIAMPVLDGLQATTLIRADCPETVVLALTVHNDLEHVWAMLRAGASGYLTKETIGVEVAQAVRTAAAGHAVLSGVALSQVVSVMRTPGAPSGQCQSTVPAALLSPREIQVLTLAARGLDNQTIAGELGVSKRTIGSHLEQIFSKLNVRSRTEASMVALRAGAITLEDVL